MNLNDIKILDIHPSQFYVSKEKIQAVREWFSPDDFSDFQPLPIKELNGRLIFTDGHTRAWVAYCAGLEKVPLVWDEDDLDWEAYQICVDECEARGVHTVADFQNRILPAEEYVEKWNKWCEKIQGRG